VSVKALVLIADGSVDRLGICIGPNAIALPADDAPVPVLAGFEGVPIGAARLSVAGQGGERLEVWAEITPRILGLSFEGLYPCVGGKVEKFTVRADGVRDLERISLLVVGLCSQNVDPRIPPL